MSILVKASRPRRVKGPHVARTYMSPVKVGKGAATKITDDLELAELIKTAKEKAKVLSVKLNDAALELNLKELGPAVTSD